jgi:hypothetical protein
MLNYYYHMIIPYKKSFFNWKCNPTPVAMGVVIVAMATWLTPQVLVPRTRPHVNRSIGSKDICYIVQGGHNSGVNWGHTPIWPTCVEALTCIEYVCTRTTLIGCLVLLIMQRSNVDLGWNISNISKKISIFSKKITPLECTQILDWTIFGRDSEIQCIIYREILQHGTYTCPCILWRNRPMHFNGKK